MDEFSAKKKEDLEYAFSLYDDGNGKMDAKLFSNFLGAMGHYCTTADAQQLLESVDLSVDGFVQKEEALMAIAAKEIAWLKEDEMRNAFSKFDKSGDKKLSRDELMDMLTNYGHEKMSEEQAKEMVDEMLNVFDADEDGHLRYDEFVNAMFFV